MGGYSTLFGEADVVSSFGMHLVKNFFFGLGEIEFLGLVRKSFFRKISGFGGEPLILVWSELVGFDKAPMSSMSFGYALDGGIPLGDIFLGGLGRHYGASRDVELGTKVVGKGIDDDEGVNGPCSIEDKSYGLDLVFVEELLPSLTLVEGYGYGVRSFGGEYGHRYDGKLVVTRENVLKGGGIEESVGCSDLGDYGS